MLTLDDYLLLCGGDNGDGRVGGSGGGGCSSGSGNGCGGCDCCLLW